MATSWRKTKPAHLGGLNAVGLSIDAMGTSPEDPPAARGEHVLGPVFIHVPHIGRRSRISAGMVGLACVGLLGVAGWLKPDPSGTGTHTQLGVLPCSTMVVWGIPCPTCGMTTAFAHTVRGQWGAALRAQPAGWLAALAVGALAMLSAATVVTGRRWAVNWYRVPPGRVVLGCVVVVLAAWAYRIGVVVTQS
ncbi:MAG: DUF2752 domain-containing protein [bacterium]|nr:DUF2752 domain-containing protein [bacterium]